VGSHFHASLQAETVPLCCGEKRGTAMGVGEAIHLQDSNVFGWTNGVTALWGRVSPEGLLCF
jgi:hypothetical protein